MRCLKPTILLLTLFLRAGFIFSQTISNFLHFEEFSVSDGLAGNDIQTLFQDSRGFLWIGTAEGLSRYDGRVFKKYTRIGKDGLTDHSINCIKEDADGYIWIGTENGLNKLDPFSESITRYYEGTGPGTIPYKWCNALYLDKEKTLWLSSGKGIASFDKHSNRFTNYPIRVFGPDSRINKAILCMLEDRKGRFWLATSYGVKLFDRKGGRTLRSFHTIEDGDEGLNKNVIYSLFEDSAGLIWAGTFADGLFWYNETTGEFEKTILTGVAQGDYVIQDISELKIHNQRYLLLATGAGVLCLRYIKEETGKTNSPAIFDQVEYLGGKLAVTDFLTDSQQTLWWAGNKGLFKMNADRLDYEWLPVNNKRANGPFVFHIIPDSREPERFFYLTTNDGWWKYDRRASTIVPHALPAGHELELTSINDWYPDKNGYWFTSVRGFGYYDIYRNQLIDLSTVPQKMTGQRSTGFIEKDLYGKFWVTLRRSGIMIYDPISKTTEQLFGDSTQPKNTYGHTITDLQMGPDGKIYFCAPHNLYRVDPSDRSFQTFGVPEFPEPIDDKKICPQHILFTRDKRILVISNFRVYELKNEQLQVVYPLNGLSDFVMEKIVAGTGDIIWITTAQSVLKTNSSFSHWADKGELLGISKGFPPFEIYTGLPAPVIFTGDGGIGLLQEPASPAATTIRPVIISRVKHGEQEIFLASEKKTTLKTSYKNAIEIDISPVSYLAEKENKVMYRLEGWDDNWKLLTGTSPIRYEQLPPGHYHFKAKAVHSDGKESKESSFSFTITPPFYRTWWFLSGVVLFIGLAIFAFYRYRLQAALKMERLRTNIATDLHDDIGATLSSISMYSEAVKNQVKDQLPHLEPVLDKMGENSRDMVNSMSDIVWAINPNNDDGKKLAQRIESHARDMCAIKNVVLHFTGDDDMSDIKLPLEFRKNIYLIFKEALNNALKYSQASEINISISRDRHRMHLQIDDNGIGFNTNNHTGGNGLKNMEQRAREIRSTLQLVSEPGKGTKLELFCPV